MGPGSVFVIELAISETTMEDADEAVRERS
jgi:hypothetical protein